MELEKQKENSTKTEEQAAEKSSQAENLQDSVSQTENHSSDAEQSSADNELAVVQDELTRALEELELYKDRFVRTVAEMDNLRKRTERERSDLLKYGTEKVMAELLPVLDSFEKAVLTDQSNATVDSLIEGMNILFKQLQSALEKHGLEPIEAKGQKFDPNYHQAIQRIESDVTEDTVQEEFQKGYCLNGRLIRPAIVSVAVPGSVPEKEV